MRAGRALGAVRSASPRRRIAHDGGVILAQDGSWRFFGRGGEGGDAGRVLRDADRTVGDFGRLARQGFFSCVLCCRLVCKRQKVEARLGGVVEKRHGLCPVLFYGVAPYTVGACRPGKPVLTDLEISRERRGSRGNR